MTSPIPPAILDTLRRADRVLLACHVNPDGDALGSLLALRRALSDLGKTVVSYVEGPVPQHYGFLPGIGEVATELPALDGFSAAMALDCGDELRLGRQHQTLLTVHPFLVVDHHLEHRSFGDFSWVDASRSSTGEMIYELILALGAPLAKESAFCLYAAIASDTGSFRYPSTTAQAFRIAQDLMLAGVEPAVVSGELFDNYTVSRLKLLQLVLATLELAADQRIAIIEATPEMFAATGTTPADTEHFISFPRALASVQVAVFIRQSEEGVVSVSLRSKGELDVARVAAGLGGGGHRNAAGVRIRNQTLAQVRRTLVAQLTELVAR
ncbi:MAG: bifunctional oligoribonuclease/PAP phosphatase NrnA [Thermodesulfobacteriota bacterium]